MEAGRTWPTGFDVSVIIRLADSGERDRAYSSAPLWVSPTPVTYPLNTPPAVVETAAAPKASGRAARVE